MTSFFCLIGADFCIELPAGLAVLPRWGLTHVSFALSSCSRGGRRKEAAVEIVQPHLILLKWRGEEGSAVSSSRQH